MGLLKNLRDKIQDTWWGKNEGPDAIKEGYQSAIDIQKEYEDKAMGQFGEVDALQKDPNSLKNLPFFQFLMDQGMGALQRQKTAGGKFFSGETSQDLINFASGTAAMTYGDEWNRRFQLGSTKAGLTTQFGENLSSLYANKGRDVGSQLFQWSRDQRAFSHDFGMSAWNSYTGGNKGGGGNNNNTGSQNNNSGSMFQFRSYGQ